MTKKKRPRGGGGVWYGQAHVLGDEAKKKLASIAGYDITDSHWAEYLQKHFMQIEWALGSYSGAVQNLDNAQTPGEYVKDVKRLRKLAAGLLNGLIDSTGWTRDELEAEGTTVTELELAIGQLLDSLREVEKKYEKEKLAGNKRKDGLRFVTKEILRVFHFLYMGDSSPRVTQGAIVKASAFDRAEEEFVVAALKDANIPIPNPIRRYFDGDHN